MEDTFSTEEFRFMNEKDKTNMMHLDMESGEHHELTGAEMYDLVYNSGCSTG